MNDNLNTYYKQKNKSEELYDNEEDMFKDAYPQRKLSEAEKMFSTPEMEELKHINRHLIKNMNDIKTLDVKIMELRDEPDNLQLLFDVMAMIY